MRIAIDFDGVIHNPNSVLKGQRMGVPVAGALEGVRHLARQHDLIVFSTRAGTPGGPKAIRDWLEFFNFPRMEVTHEKPMADAYLDDKAVPFVNWGQAYQDLQIVNRKVESRAAARRG